MKRVFIAPELSWGMTSVKYEEGSFGGGIREIITYIEIAIITISLG